MAGRTTPVVRPLVGRGDVEADARDGRSKGLLDPNAQVFLSYRGLHGLADDWRPERQAAAAEILEAADAEMKRAADLITSTQPGVHEAADR